MQVPAPVKVAFLAALVALYWQPEALLQLAGEQGTNMQVQVVRFLLTMGTIWIAVHASCLLWLSVLVALVQGACWALFLARDRDHKQVGEQVEAQKQLFQLGTVVCFAALWVLNLFFRGDPKQERFRQRLRAFYAKHNPAKLKEVDTLVLKYDGNEDLLFTRLHRKYNALSVDGDGAAKKAAKIDEGAFLYEQSEDEAVETDAANEADNEADSESDMRLQADSSSADSEVDEGFHVVKPPSPVRVTGAASPVSTPPVSPRSAAPLAHTRRQSSKLIQDAIAEARRAQEARVQERIARLFANKPPQASP